MNTSHIVVVGSCMIDFVSYCSRLPQVGETIHGSSFATNFGGKGANQCVAAAKIGAKTSLIACVGDDVWGLKYIENLKQNRVDTSHVKIVSNCNSGIAQINVASNGDNQIVIISGANEKLDVLDVKNAYSVIQEAGVLILQLETSCDVAIAALELCKGISILNGAPAIQNCDYRILTKPTIFCVNETEAEIFSGITVNNIGDAEVALKKLLEIGCQTVIITLGSKGAVFANKESSSIEHVSSPQVKCLDSTGAGDAFIGALAYFLANHKEFDLKKCIEGACYVASDSVTKLGTQPSFPDERIVKNYLNGVPL